MNPFTTNELSYAWINRKDDLHRANMRKYGDILYERLAAMVTETRDEIHERMRERIYTATKKADLHISIFTYNARMGKCIPTFGQTNADMLCAVNGWNPTVAVENELKPEPLYYILRSTDVCKRLSLLFGVDFWVAPRRTGKITDELSSGYTIVEYELALSYFPDGLHAQYAIALDALMPRETYVPTNRVIWWDDGPRTPPMPVAAVPPQPPPVLRLPQRSNGAGIYVYDSMEEAARDTIRDILSECGRECHCYNPEDDE